MTAAANKPATMAGMELHGAPDLDIGKAEKEQRINRAMQIDLRWEIIEEMKKCMELGKLVQLLLGKTPALRIGERTRPLRISPSLNIFRCELYRTDEQHNNKLHFESLVRHEMAVLEAPKGGESALATLQASLQAYEKEKEDNKATFFASKDTASTVKSINAKSNGKNKVGPNAGNSEKKQSFFFQEFARSYQTNSSINRPPTSTPPKRIIPGLESQSPRFVVLHMLAVVPRLESVLLENTKIPKVSLLPLLAKHAYKDYYTDSWNIKNECWHLTERYFKELNVWEFPYTDFQRERAIRNAIRAYDRMRLPRDDKLWQLLLVHEKRGKGIVLSNLKLNGSGTPANSSPPGQAKSSPASLSGKKRPLNDVAADSAGLSSSSEPAKKKMALTRAATNKKTVNATGPAKSSSTATAIKAKKTSTATKPKADAKFKSDEYVHDSSDSLGDETAHKFKAPAKAAYNVKDSSNAAHKFKDTINAALKVKNSINAAPKVEPAPKIKAAAKVKDSTNATSKVEDSTNAAPKVKDFTNAVPKTKNSTKAAEKMEIIHDLISEFKAKYNGMFTKHITDQFELDQLPVALHRDKTEHFKNFEVMKSIRTTVEYLQSYTGRSNEAFPNIPDEFSTASVPGLMDYLQFKINGLKERTSESDATNLADPDFPPAQKVTLRWIYNEIEQLEELQDH